MSEQEPLPWDSASGLAVPAGHALGTPSPLFARVEMDDINQHRKRLGTPD